MWKASFFLSIGFVTLLVTNTAAQQAGAPVGAGQKVQVIEVTAKRYQYDPSEIHVKKGTRVQLKLRALDRTHGFLLSTYPEGSDGKGRPGLVLPTPQVSWKLEKGQVNVVEFIADQPGTYDFKCSVICGWHHRSMKGKLIVEP